VARLVSGELAGQRGSITMNQGDLGIRPARAEAARAITERGAAAYRHSIARIGKLPGPMLDNYRGVMQQPHVLVLAEGVNILVVRTLIRQPKISS
jgi:hypothetical protein